jgi:hypothetical protein
VSAERVPRRCGNEWSDRCYGCRHCDVDESTLPAIDPAQAARELVADEIDLLVIVATTTDATHDAVTRLATLVGRLAALTGRLRAGAPVEDSAEENPA